MSDLWAEASRDIEAERLNLAVTAARVSVQPIWAFLAGATDDNDYAHRKAIIAEHVDAAVEAAVSEPDPALYETVHDAVMAALDCEFEIIKTQRMAAAEPEARARIEAALEVEAGQKAARDLQPGDTIIHEGQPHKIGKVDTTTTPGSVAVWHEGNSEPRADHIYNHGDPVKTARLVEGGGTPFVSEADRSTEAAADSPMPTGKDSIFCGRCKGTGMVNMGGAIRNCTKCKGSGLKPGPRKTVQDAVGREGALQVDAAKDHEHPGEGQWTDEDVRRHLQNIHRVKQHGLYGTNLAGLNSRELNEVHRRDHGISSKASLQTEASYYVHRKRGPRPDYGENDPPREGWVGPIRSEQQAHREKDAWREAGHEAEVHPSSPEVKKRVREWQKSVKERRKASLIDLARAAVEQAISVESREQPGCPRCGSKAVMYSKFPLGGMEGHTSHCRSCNLVFNQEHAYAPGSYDKDNPVERHKNASLQAEGAEEHWLDRARRIHGGQGKGIYHEQIDHVTAGMLTQVHDALSPENQAKFKAMPLHKAVDVGWKVVNRSKKGAYNPFNDQNNPYVNPKKPDADELRWREHFPEGVPLHGDLTPEQERELKRRGSFADAPRVTLGSVEGHEDVQPHGAHDDSGKHGDGSSGGGGGDDGKPPFPPKDDAQQQAPGEGDGELVQGQQVNVHYAMPDGTKGECPATVQTADGQTATLTYENGTFTVTKQGEAWADSAGATFTFDAGGEAKPEDKAEGEDKKPPIGADAPAKDNSGDKKPFPPKKESVLGATRQEISDRATQRAVDVAQERTRQLHNEEIGRLEAEERERRARGERPRQWNEVGQYESSFQHTATPDGERSFCRICGRELESQDNIWYALKASAPKRDVDQHHCLPARMPGANWPGEFNAEGELVPGTPEGIYDAGANLIRVSSFPTEAEVDPRDADDYERETAQYMEAAHKAYADYLAECRADAQVPESYDQWEEGWADDNAIARNPFEAAGTNPYTPTGNPYSVGTPPSRETGPNMGGNGTPPMTSKPRTVPGGSEPLVPEPSQDMTVKQDTSTQQGFASLREVEGYGVAGDPQWITARHSGVCASGECHNEIKPGDRVFFYPRGRKAYCAEHSDAVARRAESELWDEDVNQSMHVR